MREKKLGAGRKKLLAMLLEWEKQSAWCCYLWSRDDAFSPRDGERV